MGRHFLTINKKYNILTVDPEAFKEMGGFDKKIKTMGVVAFSGLPAVVKMVKEARKAKLFKYPNESTNLIQKFTTFMETPKLTEKSKLAEELKKKVKIVSFVNSNREYLWT